MKLERVLLYVFAFSLLFWLLKRSSCHGCHFNMGGEKGSGHIIGEDRSVDDFSSVEATAVIDIVLKQGEQNAVRIEADDNLIAKVKTEVSGGRLEISMPDNFRLGKSSIKAFLTVKTLDELEVTGVSQVSCDGPLALDRFKLNFTGVGGVKLQGTCNDATIHSTGVGDVEAADFVCKNLEVENTGTGDVRCRADGELSIENSGVGDVEWSGSAVLKNVSSTGVGKVKKI